MENAFQHKPFTFLEDPKTYSPCTIDYQQGVREGTKATETERRWIDVFRRSIPSFRERAAQDDSVADAPTRAEKFATRFGNILDELEVDCESNGGPPDCLHLCRLRDVVLREVGFEDIFKKVKAEENEKALALLRGVLEKIDGIEDLGDRIENVVKGALAGNIFDLGASKTVEMFKDNGMDFEATLEKLLPRPWVIDNLDAFRDRVKAQPYEKAVIFVDNAGADFVLGILPFARELLKMNTKVVLAANGMPSINDMTYHEILDVIQKIEDSRNEEDLALHTDSGRLVAVNSGSDAPVIDLRYVSPELLWACEGVDLVVLEGMGRSIETNLNAKFKVDSLNIGMVKHPEVAEFLGGRMYDCVVKFTPKK